MPMQGLGSSGSSGQPVMMASPGVGSAAQSPGGPGLADTGGAGLAQYARPGMPSGLRQSFGPDTGKAQVYGQGQLRYPGK
jgi:hypothetical protein